MYSFLLQTKGYCLFCLRKNNIEWRSLQSTLNYLSVDVEKIFYKASGGSTEVDVQGTLCEKCGGRLDRVVKILEVMEKLKAKLDSCLRSIHEEINASEDGDVFKGFIKEMRSSEVTFLSLEFVGKLRMEMMNGCSQAVENFTPAQNVPANVANSSQKRSKRKLRIHMAAHPSPKNIKRSKRKRQILKMTIQKMKFACKLCPRRFSHKLLLVRHRKSSHPELHLQCDMCPAIYYFTETLKRHKLTLHSTNKAKNSIPSEKATLEASNQKRLIRCEVCDKTFQKNSRLTDHINTIHLNILFNCQRCGKSFKWRSSLDRHRKRCRKINHSGKPKSTKMVEAIQLDIRRDYEIRPRTNRPNYNIDKTFLEQLDSNKINTSSPPTLPKLILKIKINNEQKPVKVKSFKCDHCPRTYAKNIRKLDHERVVHHSILFKCDDCPKQFCKRSSLKIHRYNAHAINNSKMYEGMPTLIKIQSEIQCFWCQAKFSGIGARDIHMQRNCQRINDSLSKGCPDQYEGY